MIELWRKRWLRSINELTSYEYQKVTWNNTLYNSPHFCFVEFMCNYFDDLNIDENYSKTITIGLVSIEEFEIIKEWHFLLDKYDSPFNMDYNDEMILNDEKWIKIVQAGHNMKFLLATLLCQEEKEILLENLIEI